MSKIRNLFKKLTKKNKSDQDLEEIFADEYNDEEEFSEVDEESAPDIPLEVQNHSTEDSTGELNIDQVQASVSEYEDEDFEDEDIDLDNFTAELELGNSANDDEDFTSEIDLVDDKISLRDKAEHISTRIMDRFRGLNKKDLNELKRDSNVAGAQLQGLDKFKAQLQKYNYANIPNTFFKLANHSMYHRYFQMGTVILSVLAIGKLTSSLIQGTPSYNNLDAGNAISLQSDKSFTQDNLDQIKSANIFRTNSVEAKITKKPTTNSPAVCKEASRKSSLPIKLVNTIVLQDSVKSIASVQVRSSSKLEVFREGQKINNMAKLDRINDEKLIVKNLSTGECESIQSKAGQNKKVSRNPIRTLSPRQSRKFKQEKKSISGIKNEGNNFEIQRSFLKEKMKDISSLLTQAKGIQMNNPDGTISFKITEIDPGGIFAYLGLEDNDIITQINGEPIKDLNQVMTLFGTIANVSKLGLTKKSNGEEIQQNYTVR